MVAETTIRLRVVLLANMSQHPRRRIIHYSNGGGRALCGSEPVDWEMYEGWEDEVTCKKCAESTARCSVCGQPCHNPKRP